MKDIRMFDDDLKYNSFWQILMDSMPVPVLSWPPFIWIPYFPRFTITLMGYGILILWVVGGWLLLDVFLHLVVIPKEVHYFLALVIFINIAISGENGLRFRIWLGLEPLMFRKRDVPIDMSPKSRLLTRVFFNSLFAVEIGFWLWFQVLQTEPRYYQQWLLELMAEEPVLYAAEQFSLYWWLLPVLCFLAVFALIGFEHVPISRILLRRTRLLHLISMVVLPLESWMFLGWYDQTLQPVFG